MSENCGEMLKMLCFMLYHANSIVTKFPQFSKLIRVEVVVVLV